MTLEYLQGVGRATSCAVSANHTPVPLRFVFHHIQPQCCGGATVTENLVNLCDSCHMAVHYILFQLKVNNGVLKPNRRYNAKRIALAQQGYQLCVAAGTVQDIPEECSVTVDGGTA